MVLHSPTNPQNLPQAIGEQRVLLRVDWQGFQSILDALGCDRAARLTYDQGLLEIMTPLERHENSSGLVGQFVEILTEELNLPIKTMGATTLKRLDVDGGGEPGQSYYLANEPLVRGREVDLTRDPPPDLVVEVDISHTDIDKNALYARLGVPEFWRYNGSSLTIYCLQDGQYQEVTTSPTFPQVPREQLYTFLQNCAQQGETAAKRALRVWIREHVNAG